MRSLIYQTANRAEISPCRFHLRAEASEFFAFRLFFIKMNPRVFNILNPPKP